MTEPSAETASLCPHCLRRIPARRIFEKDAVFLKKSCPEHGDLDRVLIWRNYPKSYKDWNRPGIGTPATPAKFSDGCPCECGLCTHHKQKTCSAILEVTHRCTSRCPICFASSETDSGEDPDLDCIQSMLQAVLDHGGPCPIQLSGGEPALRNDLPQIITLARKIGFDHIQVNTNGLRLAQDADYGQALKDAGITDFFLQFDGTTEDVYRHIRGAALLTAKLKAIERCAQLRIGVILVPTVVRSINDFQIGALIQFAKKWMPVIKGVHFQPMTYVGRYPGMPRNDDRLLITDILAAVEEQTQGELTVDNFLPSG